MIAAAPIQIHATCVAFAEGGVLLRGPSGAGKSDIALRLIDRGACLVADDRVEIDRSGGVLRARAPSALAGMIEIRGIGIVRMPCAAEAELALIVDLVPRAQVERLPEERGGDLLGVRLRRVSLDPFDVSAPLKIMFALRQRATLDAAQPAA